MSMMRGTSRHVVAFAVVYASACGTGDTGVDPGDLELRDLLGVAPETASSWNAEQRAAARRVLVDALGDDLGPATISIAQGASLDERVTRTLGVLDGRRFAAGDGALALVRVELTSDELIASTRKAPTAVAATNGSQPPVVALDTSEWPALTAHASDLLAAVAVDAGHHDRNLVVVPAPRLAVIASYVAVEPPRLLVNPVLVAALDPSFVDTTHVAQRSAHDDGVTAPMKPAATAGGNPYSFYGSVAECAYAQRLRCESCLPSSNCTSVTTSSDGNAECTRLAENDGRGYFLLCINLALSITSVDGCVADTASGCSRDTNAASDLGQLEANARFLDETACASGLDSCLAKIYGEPKNPFPSIVDGGMPTPPSEPPRNTDISCGDSCSDNNSNCDASPNCSCDGPSCNNSFSCDSTCSSSNNQSGCGDNCDSCSSDTGGGGGGGGCSGDSGGSSGGGCGGCSSDSGGSSSSGGGCGGCSSDSGDSSSSGGGCGGDGGCGGGSGGGGCGGGGGGSGGCQVARKAPSAGFALALSLVWGAMPIPVAAFVKRRNRRRADKRPRDTAQEEMP
jgi:hypothetical protein